MKKLITILIFHVFLTGAQNSFAQNQKLPLELIKLPEGFHIEIFSDQVPNARSLALSPNGTVFVGTRTEGKVYALLDEDKDNKADKVFTIAEGLYMPNGVAFRDGSLYVAEVNRVIRFDDIESNLNQPLEPAIVNDKFPKDQWHGWKYIAFGPDEKLYVPIGAPCNVCERNEKLYATITRMNADGTGLEVFARGIRNSVGFDWDPQTDELWFTDNGRDKLGDDLPPDELNHAPVRDGHFGFPYCHAGNIVDPEFGMKKKCEEFQAPAVKLGAHVAALGMKFYTGNQFPADYKNKILIAEHGSWNRSKKIGYRIMGVDIKNNSALNYKVFAEGWLQGEKSWGRPVDILNLPDGSILVSDDHAGAIYRIFYKK